MIHSSLTDVHCFDIGYVGKHSVAWKENLWESMDRCIGRFDKTDILMETALNTIQSIQSIKCNTLPNNKILNQSILKAFTDIKSKVIQMAKLVLDKIDNFVGKEENAAFSTFPKMFLKGSFLRVI